MVRARLGRRLAAEGSILSAPNARARPGHARPAAVAGQLTTRKVPGHAAERGRDGRRALAFLGQMTGGVEGRHRERRAVPVGAAGVPHARSRRKEIEETEEVGAEEEEKQNKKEALANSRELKTLLYTLH